MEAEPSARLGRDAKTWWAGPLALGLAIATFVHLGLGLDAAIYACVQVVLVVLAATDVAQRRLPNALTVPVAAAALALRGAVERHHLAGAAAAGAVAFAAFLVLSVATRGGVGMGDVKLAAMLGFLLGWPTAAGALILGVVAGGLAGTALLLSSRATLRSSIAYGPYLALGGAIAILALHPAPLV